MILIVDSLNRHLYPDILEDMFRLRARIFGGRLGWEVDIQNGLEHDMFDDLDPAYIIGFNSDMQVISCMRALQTTGPHMLSDVFSAILGDEPPMRSSTIWEATRFCVDTELLSRSKGARKTISQATCELNIGALEYAIEAGITDVIAVVDPIMDRVLRRSGNGAYDYLGHCVPCGKTSALAGLIDCTEERLTRVRKFASITGDIYVNEDELRTRRAAMKSAMARKSARTASRGLLENYLMEQIGDATTAEELQAALSLTDHLLGAHVEQKMPSIRSLRA